MISSETRPPIHREFESTFLSLDFQALSLFKIAISVYLLSDFYVSVYPYFEDFYGNSGIVPLSVLVGEIHQLSSFNILPYVKAFDIFRFGGVFAPLYTTATLALAFGYRTGWSNALVFVLNGYLYWLNPYINSGAETLAHLLLLWSLFLPVGRYWSVDAALDSAPRRRPYPILPFVAMRLQIASLYVFAALFKLAGLPWRDGIAVTWAFSDGVFGSTSSGLFLVHHAPALLHVMNYLVIAFQLSFPFLIYCPWRNDFVRAIALICSAAMHASFIFFLNVGGFPYICLVMLSLLVPDKWFDRLLRARRQRLAGVVVFYEPGCGFCHRIALVLREFLLAPTSQVVPSSTNAEANAMLLLNNSWVVRGADGKLYLKWHAMDYLLRQNPLFAPIAWIFERAFMQGPMEKLYDAIGSSRNWLASVVRRLLPLRSSRSIGRPALVLCGLLMTFALTSNILSLARLAFPDLSRFDDVFAVTQIKQGWEVFAPRPTHFRRKYSVVAHLGDGSTVDVMNLLPIPIFRIDEVLHVSFSSPRWAKYYTRFDDLTDQDWFAFGRHLCRLAQFHVATGTVVRQIEFTAMTAPMYEMSDVKIPFEHRVFDCWFST